MNSFTEDIKEEITARSRGASPYALMSGYAQVTGGVVHDKDGYGLKVVTENKNTASFLVALLAGIDIHPQNSGVRTDVIFNRDKLFFEYWGDDVDRFMEDAGLMSDGAEEPDIPQKVTTKKSDKIAYIKGAFLGSGSCTLPDKSTYSRTSYHFELICPTMDIADEMCDLLMSFDIIAKTVIRKASCIVYIKSKEVISDLLNLLGCKKSLKRLDSISEFKEERNNANRASNCAVSNIDKTVTASVKQVQAIETIKNSVGIYALEKSLRDVAVCREENVDASMSELAGILGISKSCLSHRLRRIQAIADDIVKQQSGGVSDT